MPDDLPCFQRLFHIDNPLVLRTAECQCHAVKFLNKLAVHEDIEDKNQTVEIDKLNGAKGKVYEKTGLDLGKYAWAIALAAVAGAALIVGGAVAWKRSRKGKGAEGGLFGDE